MSISPTVPHLGIVVGVDGSPASAVAVDWAARDAALRAVPLTLVHIAHGIAATLSASPLPAGFGRWQQERGQEFLNDAVRIAENAAGRPGALRLNTELYYSAAVPTLVDLSKDADLVVVGRRGQGAFGDTLGSVSLGLLHHAHCPVAVVHDQDPLMPHPAQAPVVVGIDGSATSEQATAIAFDEASRRGVALIAVHAWSDEALGGVVDPEWTARLEGSADAVLAERLAGWQERYPDVPIHRRVVCDHPARQLVVQSEAAQLIVVGSHGRGGFAGMLLGSVSTAVVRLARMPVIVARR